MCLYKRVKVYSAKEMLCFFFLVFCFIPFLFPNPIVKTNIQPYASLIGTIIILLYCRSLLQSVYGRNIAVVLGSTFLVALIIMVIGGISINAIRGVYNYYALFVVPCSTVIVLEELEEFPERLFKDMIVIWFFVATVQFFVYRGFATQLIAGVRWSFEYRGVVGLASEPSFLGITCFYFLHIIKKFRTQKLVFGGLTLVMGILYAQSITGIIFMSGIYVVFLLDVINSKKGIYICGISIITFTFFAAYLNTKMANSRLNQMIEAFLDGGIRNVLLDVSANVRFNAIGRALKMAIGNFLFPNGFGSRIGSAYGGLLVELGFFAIPAIFLISFCFSLTFKKMRSRVAYFMIITLLLLNNTQIGNPLLLMVMGVNLYDLIVEKRCSRVKEENVKDS